MSRRLEYTILSRRVSRVDNNFPRGLPSTRENSLYNRCFPIWCIKRQEIVVLNRTIFPSRVMAQLFLFCCKTNRVLEFNVFPDFDA